MEYPVVAILFGSFLVLLLIGAPITVSLAVSALACFWVLDIDPVRMVQIAYTSVGSFPLMALPAFVLAGAKAWLEQGVQLNLVPDRHPDAHVEVG